MNFLQEEYINYPTLYQHRRSEEEAHMKMSATLVEGTYGNERNPSGNFYRRLLLGLRSISLASLTWVTLILIRFFSFEGGVIQNRFVLTTYSRNLALKLITKNNV